jgi:glycogen debranching enzyme
MVPQDAWRYIVARVREEYPDTVFMLEGLGGKLEVTEALLTQANLDWAYSELFQTYERGHIESYLPFTTRLSSTAGLLVHYAETHDNNRLAAASAAFARLRTGLTALCSANGAFGITAGVEWLATEKVDVHGASPLRWGATENLVAHVARLNTLLATHPCFGAEADFRVLPYGAGNRIAAVRSCRRSDRRVLVLVNLDPGRPTDASWPLGDFVPVATGFTDLLTGKRLAPSSRDGHAWLTLDPGAAHCLTPRAEEWDALRRAESAKKPVWLGVHQQQYKALALAILLELDPNVDPACHKPDDLAEQLRCDPLGFCRHAARDAYLPVVAWQWPADTRRRVMVPPHHLLCLQAPHPFQADVRDGDRTLASVRSLPAAKGGHFAFAVRLPADPARHRALEVVFTLYEPDQTRTTRTPLLALCPFEAAQVHRVFAGPDAVRRDLYGILANRRGTMVQARAAWASIASLYDALLAVNLAPSCPADRQVLLTRVRAWLRHREYSHEINGSCVRTFAARTGEALEWHLTVPAGMGKLVRLFFRLTLAPDANAMTLTLSRPSQVLDPDDLPDDQPVTLILRPDVDDRSCHGVTKAFAGPEDAWRRAVEPRADGFVFAPHPDRMLTVKAAPGGFTPEAEWTYHVAHPFESDRGLPDRSDLFSPGYFSVCLRGGESAELRAHEGRATAARCAPPPAPHRRLATPHGDWHPLSAGLRDALDDFVVRRDDGLTVIAGYPWFLDWGRDTLICLRGYIAAGALSDSLGILRQFARFEDRGTLPNMIRGNDASNRDTTDAPLWFLVACADLLAATGDPAFLDGDLGGKRTVRQVALSILEHYSRGTPNGVRMDPATGLVYSPPHFTWMDTNFPAATPRAGYPVEIQALWHAGLRFATQSLSPDPQWAELATRVRASFHRLFVRPGQAHLSDCLHAAPGQSAADAVPDDALRPNQLLAITLGLLRDEEKARAVVRSCDELLVPGGIRSLADRPVAHAQPIWRNGALLNDALRPYWGQYRGDEDTRRKPAYHNGTAWTWLFPSYAEALVAAFGPSAGDAARALLGSATLVLDDGCAGHVAEIADGDAPHTWRGCGAQAWGVTELQRVIALLTRKS